MSEILRPKDYDLIVNELSESKSRQEVMRHIEGCAHCYAQRNYYFYTLLSEALARVDSYETESDVENYFINDADYSDDLSEYADAPSRFLRFAKVYADFLDYDNELVQLDDEFLKPPIQEHQEGLSDLKVIVDALRKLLVLETDEETTSDTPAVEISGSDRCDEFHSFKSLCSAEKLLEIKVLLEKEKIIDTCNNDIFLRIFSNLEHSSFKGEIKYLIQKDSTNDLRPLFVILRNILHDEEFYSKSYPRYKFFEKIKRHFELPFPIESKSIGKSYGDFQKALKKDKWSLKGALKLLDNNIQKIL
jgi:hypothetical protein